MNFEPLGNRELDPDFLSNPRAQTDGRFVPRRKYDIKNIWERQGEMIRRTALGLSNKEVADEIGCSAQTVSNVRNSPLGRAKLAELTARLDEETLDIQKRIQQFAPQALEVLENIIEGRYEEASLNLRAKVASDHLARAGHGTIQKSSSISTVLTADEISRIKARSSRAQAEMFGEKNVTPSENSI